MLAKPAHHTRVDEAAPKMRDAIFALLPSPGG
jgi:hypothetical protein